MNGWIIIAAAVVAATIAGAWYCCRETFYVDRKACADPHTPMSGSQYEPYREQTARLVDKALELPCEDVYTVSDDGLRLHGRLFRFGADAPVELMVHGYRSMAYRDFCGALLSAMERGHNVLLIDQRAHGESGGQYLSFGIKEKNDCRCWINFIISRFGSDVKIILMGLSMGAGTVLMTAGPELPDNVRGIVADSPYTSPELIIRKVIRDRKLPQWPVFPLVALGAGLFAGFSLHSEGPVDTLRQCPVPVLLIHGDEDRFVPYEMSVENKRACASPCELMTVKGAGHALASYVGGEEYYRRVAEFTDAVCAEKEPML